MSIDQSRNTKPAFKKSKTLKRLGVDSGLGGTDVLRAYVKRAQLSLVVRTNFDRNIHRLYKQRP